MQIAAAGSRRPLLLRGHYCASSNPTNCQWVLQRNHWCHSETRVWSWFCQPDHWWALATVLWAGHAEQDAARLHSSSCREMQYLFGMINLDEFCQIHQSCGLTHVARFDACVWAHACLCVGPARCEMGRLDGDTMAANSICEMHGACGTADRWVLCSYISNWTHTQLEECARPSLNNRARWLTEWLHPCGKQFWFILSLGVCMCMRHCVLFLSFLFEVSLWSLLRTTHPTRIYKSFLQHSKPSFLVHGHHLPNPGWFAVAVTPVSISLLFWTCI